MKHALLELKSLNDRCGMFRLFLLFALVLTGCALNSGSFESTGSGIHVPEGEPTATRVVWWSNEAGENMRREGWKVMETLSVAGE